jgi:hypothetical protein
MSNRPHYTQHKSCSLDAGLHGKRQLPRGRAARMVARQQRPVRDQTRRWWARTDACVGRHRADSRVLPPAEYARAKRQRNVGATVSPRDTTVCTLGVHLACEMARAAGLCVHVVAPTFVLINLESEEKPDGNCTRTCARKRVPRAVDRALRAAGFRLRLHRRSRAGGADHYELRP